MACFSEIRRTNTILYCHRWAETVGFYRDQLGLKVSSQCEWMVEFHLSPTAFLSVADQSRTTIESSRGKGITLSFQINNLEAAHRDLTRVGLMPTTIRSQVMGADVFYIWDPEGTRIELWMEVDSTDSITIRRKEARDEK